jgi:hypothetical protein
MEMPKSEDAQWLKDYIERMKENPNWRIADAKRLEDIARGCDQLLLYKKRDVGLERKVDKLLCQEIEGFLEQAAEGEEVDQGNLWLMALWLTGRQMRSAGTMSGITSIIGLLGGGALTRPPDAEGPGVRLGDVLGEAFDDRTENEKLRDRVKGGRKPKG